MSKPFPAVQPRYYPVAEISFFPGCVPQYCVGTMKAEQIREDIERAFRYSRTAPERMSVFASTGMIIGKVERDTLPPSEAAIAITDPDAPMPYVYIPVIESRQNDEEWSLCHELGRIFGVL